MPLTLLLSPRCLVAYLQLQSDVSCASLLTSPPERPSLSGCRKVLCIAPHVQPDGVNGKGAAGFVYHWLSVPNVKPHTGVLALNYRVSHT